MQHVLIDFDEKQPPYTVEADNRLESALPWTNVTFYDAAPEKTMTDEDGNEKTVYPYEVLFLRMAGQKDEVEARVTANMEKYHEAAIQQTREIAMKAIPKPTIAELADLLIDQECRLALLEMGVSL